MDELTFEEEKHEYKLNDKLIPSVTTIMQIMTNKKYADISEDVIEKAQERGTAVHFAIEVFNKTEYLGINENYKGYILAYQKWIEDYNIDISKIKSETKVYNKTLWYAGTIDLIYNDDTIIDIKTTNIIDIKNCAVQLSAYQKALECQNKDVKIKKRYILWLKNDGTYKCIKLEDKFNIFLSCLQIYNYLKEE